MLHDFIQDCRYAWRGLLTHRGFSASAVVTLALGIGATTSIFSVVDGVVLRPLPFRDPERLVVLYGTPAIRGEAYLWLIGTFAALAIVLAAIGIHGVMSCIGSTRMREFAVRLALGATRVRLSTLVVGQAARLTALGLFFGIVTTLAAAPLVRNMPIAVPRPDGVLLAAVAALVGAASVGACLIPALGAARIQPMAALREE